MHTHHKILWTMALLACGSSLTPVKGTPPNNNLTESVQAVITKIGSIDDDSDIAQTIGAQASILVLEAKLIKAVTAVKDAVGGVASDVVANVSTSTTALNTRATDLATAVAGVKDAVGGLATSDVFTNVNTSTTALQAGGTVLATAVTDVKDAVGGLATSDVFTNVNTSTTALQAGGTVLATAVTAVQSAIGNVTGGEADDVYKQLTGNLGAINKINSDTTTLAEAIESLINTVGPIDTYGDIVKTIQNKNNLLAMPDSTP
jgi:hypothetical protein